MRLQMIPSLRSVLLSGTAALSLSPLSAMAAEGGMPSLRELTSLSVTSVSRQKEKISEAAAAVSVLTSEDIRRSGATSIVEALRMVPGVQVARSASGEWAVSVRGFNDQFANKLLVLIDGRTVYTPLYSGVHWDIQDMLLDNIDRIEVIRGPGATMWGSNAVNGVINIITKTAAETQGTYVQGLGGTDERQGSGRYGGRIGETIQYRVHAKHRDYDALERANGDSAGDDWNITQGGGRVDWQPSERDEFSFFSDFYDGSKNLVRSFPTINPLGARLESEDFKVDGGYLMSNWKRTWSEDSRTTLQATLDYNRRKWGQLGDHQITTYELDFQHALSVDDAHEVTWGAGYRLVSDHLENTFYSRFDPTERNDRLLSAFVQDKYALVDDELFLTLGSKFEENNYTGFEVQPNARLSWLALPDTTLWTSVSRAVRIPNRSMDDISYVVAPLPTGNGFARLTGDRNAESEELIAYEAGFRTLPWEDFSLDVTAFYNDYDQLAANVTGTPFIDINSPFGPYLALPLTPGGLGSGRAYGFEAAASWQAMPNWKLDASYSLLKMQLDGPASAVSAEGSAPQNQFNLRSSLNLGKAWEFDQMLYFNDNLSAENVDAYARFDMRLGWTPTPGVDISLVGQNLLDERHAEFSPFIYNTPAEVGRSVYGSLTLRF